jgi:hypothetical protein
MAPGETNDLVAQNSKAGIPGAVLLESGSGPMCTPAVDFDNESLVAPEEVDLVSGNPSIELGLGKAVAPTERKETRLQLAARAIRLERVVEREPEELGLS